MKIAIYKVSTGEIVRHIECPPDHVSIQCNDGEEFYLNCTKDANYIVNNESVYIAPEPPSIDELIKNIRINRNILLSESDWSVLYDIPMPEEKRLQWLEYRQQLRDFPDNCDINNPIFPVKPTGE